MNYDDVRVIVMLVVLSSSELSSALLAVEALRMVIPKGEGGGSLVLIQQEEICCAPHLLIACIVPVEIGRLHTAHVSEREAVWPALKPAPVLSKDRQRTVRTRRVGQQEEVPSVLNISQGA